MKRLQLPISAGSHWPVALAIALGVGLSLNCSSADPPIGGNATGGDASSGASAGGGAAAGAAGAEGCRSPPSDVYHARIEPLLTDENPKTCNQCHLSGVDLSVFVRPTPCETMACLVQDGLVNPDAPEQSKILSWILRASPDSALITKAVIQAEYDGFLQWIEASASCPSACADVTCGPAQAAQKCEIVAVPSGAPPELGGASDCTDATLEELFYDEVYAWRARCFPCHVSDQLKAAPDAPRWLRVEGNCATSSLASYRIVTSGDYLNLDEPDQSLLLLKPLSVEAGGVEHGGHAKFDGTADPAYQAFLRFIQQYADCKR